LLEGFLTVSLPHSARFREALVKIRPGADRAIPCRSGRALGAADRIRRLDGLLKTKPHSPARRRVSIIPDERIKLEIGWVGPLLLRLIAIIAARIAETGRRDHAGTYGFPF